MDGTTGRTLLAVVLGVVALAVVAGGIPPTDAGADGGTGGTGGVADAGDRSTGDTLPAGGDRSAGGGSGVVAVVLLAVFLLATVGSLLTDRPITRVVGALVGALALVAAAYLLDRAGGVGVSGVGGLPLPSAGGGDAAGGAGGAVGGVLLALAVAAVGGLAVVVALHGTGTGATGAADDADDGETADDPGPLGRAAGRTADRIAGGGSLDNEVYRCWRAMTASLPVSNPAASTPREFEAAARRSGVDPDDARDLTRLFERVRYGGRDPSPADERRAVEVLRRIEATYAEADDPRGGASDRGRARGPDRTGDGGSPR